MKIINWLNENQVFDYKNVYVVGGKFQYGMRWQDYITYWKHPLDIKRVEVLRDYILQNNIKQLAPEFKDTIPLFDDNMALIMSFRAWGDLLAATWAEQENTDYSYVMFSY